MTGNGTENQIVKYKVGEFVYNTMWDAVKASIEERNKTSNGSYIEEVNEFNEFYY